MNMLEMLSRAHDTIRNYSATYHKAVASIRDPEGKHLGDVDLIYGEITFNSSSFEEVYALVQIAKEELINYSLTLTAS